MSTKVTSIKVRRLMKQREALLQQMKRYLPVLEALDKVDDWWITCSKGTGIATLNAYKDAIKAAEEEG